MELHWLLPLPGQSGPVVLKANRFNCEVNPFVKRTAYGSDFEATIKRGLWRRGGRRRCAMRTRLPPCGSKLS